MCVWIYKCVFVWFFFILDHFRTLDVDRIEMISWIATIFTSRFSSTDFISFDFTWHLNCENCVAPSVITMAICDPLKSYSSFIRCSCSNVFFKCSNRLVLNFLNFSNDWSHTMFDMIVSQHWRWRSIKVHLFIFCEAISKPVFVASSAVCVTCASNVLAASFMPNRSMEATVSMDMAVFSLFLWRF